MSLAIQMQNLPLIEDVIPKGVNDDACFQDVKEVLERHGKLDRFGLCLLHDHFPMGEDEMLAETCDEETRTLTIKPVKSSNLVGRGSIETVWRLDTGVAQLCCHKHGTHG